MANNVFANGREISCKKADGKTICCFPDVCMTPPENPATPPGVPVPYPNTAFSKDTSDGSKEVKISGQEIILKNKSFFKTSTGDEAGCAAKKGVMTSKIKGKAYFTAWSMDVKVEGENVVRHLDLTTHNHGSSTNTAPWIHLDEMSAPHPDNPCKDEIKKAQKECASSKVENGKRVSCTDKCKKAMGCIFVPKKHDKKMCCSPENTGDHMIEDHWIWEKKHSKLMRDLQNLNRQPKLTLKTNAYQNAPTMCVNRSRFSDKHGIGHGTRGVMEDTFIKPERKFTMAAGRAMAVMANKHTYPDSGCKRSCIESQLDAFYGPPQNEDGSNRELRKPDRRQSLTKEQREKAMTRVFG